MSHALELEIEMLEARLSRLKAKLAASKEEGREKPLSHLHGILKGKACSTEENIDAALYHFDWEGEEIR